MFQSLLLFLPIGNPWIILDGSELKDNLEEIWIGLKIRPHQLMVDPNTPTNPVA